MRLAASFRWFLYVLCGLFLFIWIAGEANFYFGQPGPENRDALIEQALSGAVQTFETQEQDFLNATRQLVSSVEPLLAESAPATRVHNRLLNEEAFRGVTIFKEGEAFTWSGTPLSYLPAPNQTAPFIDVQQSGYIIYFVGQITFHDARGTRYDVVTSRLIRRAGASPQLLTQQYDVTREWASQQIYPVHYRFFDSSVAPVGGRQRILHTSSVDSIGLVTASTADLPALQRNWHRDKVLFRQLLAGLLKLSFFFGAAYFLHRSPFKLKGLYLLLLSAGVWSSFRLSRLPAKLAEQAGFSFDASLLTFLFSDAVFISVLGLGTWHLIHAVRSSGFGDNARQENLRRPLFYLFPGGLAAGGGGAWMVCSLFRTVQQAETGVLALKIFPAFQTWIVYLSALLLFSAFLALLFMMARLLTTCSSGHRWLSRLLFFLGVVAGILLFAGLEENALPPRLWMLFGVLSGIFFSLFMMRWLRWERIMQLSRPRLITLLVFMSMLLALPVFVGAEREKENEAMYRRAVNYGVTDPDKARQVSLELIDRLLSEGVLLEMQEVEAAPSFPLQATARFRQQVDQQIDPAWRSYTILTFLLDGRLNIIADYGSPPSFSERFSSSFHDEVRRFILESLQRPFARLPIVEADDRFRGFPVFMKGLQSIPSDFTAQPSWLVTFVLVEGRSFGRPIHDALAFHEREQEGRDRYVAARYKNRVKVASDASAAAPALPQKYRLSEAFLPPPDTSASVQNAGTDLPMRQLVYRHDETTHVVVAVRDYTWQHYIFSGFRFFVALLVFCLLVYRVFRVFEFEGGSIKLYKKEKRQRLQDRILDSYLIATLLFLVALTFVTEYIVARQNVRITEQELSRSLSALENRIIDEPQQPGPDGLQDVDMMIYAQSRLQETTTPELFRLELLSEYMPFQAYQKLYEEHQSMSFEQVNIGSLPVMMGFRTLLEDGEARRAIAIPAYTQAASYEQEFLQTTTYLIAFYIIIFLFFTGLAWVVARNLTQPLDAFKAGLRQISSGGLDTKIPVSSNDEIGELAQAYNQMLDDLVALRKELASVEREAAWSEMARQVAHEIKNPLTPMKLSIQHLQRQMHSGARSMEELKPAIERLSAMLVKQIDSLNTIASDFSAFAKPMSGPQTRIDM
ncbi:MAG: HAMP domain-containing protein, partial [Cyclonatronaceae bacterium]